MLPCQLEFQANQQALEIYFFGSVNGRMTATNHWHFNTLLLLLAQLN